MRSSTFPGPATVILGFTVMLSCGVMVPRVDAGIGVNRQS